MKKLPETMRLLTLLYGFLWLVLPAGPALAESEIDQPPVVEVYGERLDISFREVEIAEAVELLSRRGRRNIILADGIEGSVTVNLFDVTVDEAVRIIAEGAGHAVEYRNKTYFIIRRDEVGKYTDGGLMEVRTFGIQYSDVNVLRDIIKDQLSSFGSVTVFAARGMVVVRDRPEFVRSIARTIREVDREPQQVLIEAKILEITLDDSQAGGLDWARVLSNKDLPFVGEGSGIVGTQGFSQGGLAGGPGLFFEFFTPEIGVVLNALETKGRVRTLSSPTLLAIENKESEVLIGDRIGYQVTVTTNDVTTESVEFINSGVILRVTPSVDRDDRIMLNIHPEVSNGVIQNNIPFITTTEVSTNLLIPDGQTTFIGGLIRQGITETRDGVPYLSDIPLIGGLFSSESKINLRTETVVLITPRIVRGNRPYRNQDQVDKINESRRILDGEADRVRELIDESRSGWLHPKNPSAPPTEIPDDLLEEALPAITLGSDPHATGSAPAPVPVSSTKATPLPMTPDRQAEMDRDLEILRRKLAEEP